MKELLIKKMHPSATIPTRGTEGSAGADLYACIEEPIIINPGEIVMISVGVAIAIMDTNIVGLVYGRSGLGTKHGITLSNAVGVIDSDYRGEIFVSLINNSSDGYTVNPNDRIAQLVLTPVYTPKLTETDKLPETDRSTGGFGSTGR